MTIFLLFLAIFLTLANCRPKRSSRIVFVDDDDEIEDELERFVEEDLITKISGGNSVTTHSGTVGKFVL